MTAVDSEAEYIKNILFVGNKSYLNLSSGDICHGCI